MIPVTPNIVLWEYHNLNQLRQYGHPVSWTTIFHVPAVFALHFIDGRGLPASRYWNIQGMLLQNSLKTDKLNLTKGNIFAFATVIVSYEEKRTHWEFVQTNNSSVIDKGKFRVRKTSESWHTANTNKADKNSKPLPKQYPIDLNENICSLFYFFLHFYHFLLFRIYYSLRTFTS